MTGESLDDLAHDLGRHVRLPLALLPESASPAEVRAALERGVNRTRSGPTGVLGAAALLAAFRAEVPAELQPDLRGLVEAVDAAVALAASDGAPPLPLARACVHRIGEEIDMLRRRFS